MIQEKITKQVAIKRVLADRVYNIKIIDNLKDKISQNEKIQLVIDNGEKLVEMIRNNQIVSVYCETTHGLWWFDIDLEGAE
jgi:hypothetical protein